MHDGIPAGCIVDRFLMALIEGGRPPTDVLVSPEGIRILWEPAGESSEFMAKAADLAGLPVMNPPLLPHYLGVRLTRDRLDEFGLLEPVG